MQSTGLRGHLVNAYIDRFAGVRRDPIKWPCPCIFGWKGVKCDREGRISEMYVQVRSCYVCWPLMCSMLLYVFGLRLTFRMTLSNLAYNRLEGYLPQSLNQLESLRVL